jgi:SulP family sulfate permease
MDQSAIEAVFALAERYAAVGKRLHLRHLSAECRQLLGKAQAIIEVEAAEKLVYCVTENRLV